MLAPARGVIVQLPVHIAGIKPGKPRGKPAVAFAFQAVACGAGMLRSAIAAAEGNQFSTGAESFVAARVAAGRQRHEQEYGSKTVHHGRNRCDPWRFRYERITGAMGVRIVLMATLLLTACDNPQVDPNSAAPQSVVRGKAAAARLGCGACHAIPGIWPRGTSAPSLENFAQRGVIAGKLPNRPDALAGFLLDPSGTGMPKVPMTRQDAADIAAFLQQPDAP